MKIDSLNIHSLAESLSEAEIQEFLASLPPEELLALNHNWRFWARSNQLPPETDWVYWLLMAGRGFGKTRVGAEWVRDVAESGRATRIILVGPTNADVRDTMVEGESGILSVSPPWFKPLYEPSKKRITWPNGTIAQLFSAEEPERLRGPQCSHFWADELCAWERLEDTWSNLMFGFRLGKKPQGVITTTPRPQPLLKKLVKDSSTEVTTGTTYDNSANLAKPFFDKVITDYEGTRLGRQELLGHILEDNPNALFYESWFNRNRIDYVPDNLEKITVGVDPQVKEDIKSDEAGIIVAGKKKIGDVYHYFILADDSFQPRSPKEWGVKAVASYHRWKANDVVAEVNNGGALVKGNIQASHPGVPVVMVNATRGKSIRAEPVAALFEQGRVHMVGKFEDLETQCAEWDPTLERQKSPDRMDAMVWAITHLSGAQSRGMKQGRARGNS